MINLPDIIYTYIIILSYIHTGLTLFVDVLLVENIMCVYNSLVLIYDIWMGSGPPIFFLCRAHSGDVEMGHDMPESTKRVVPLLKINKY